MYGAQTVLRGKVEHIRNFEIIPTTLRNITFPNSFLSHSDFAQNKG